MCYREVEFGLTPNLIRNQITLKANNLDSGFFLLRRAHKFERKVAVEYNAFGGFSSCLCNVLSRSRELFRSVHYILN